MKKIIIFTILILSLALAKNSYAGSLFFGTESQKVGINKAFEVGIFIDTQGESINAFEGKIIFPKDKVSADYVLLGNSIVNFWVESPEISDGSISFSGIIPGGYNGTNGYLFSVIFIPKEVGKIIIETSGDKMLLNDGFGTVTKISKSPLAIVAYDFVSQEGFVIPGDKTEPLEFRPEISKDQNIFDGKYFLAFSTQDKESGIEKYFVKEGDSEYVEAKSPYLLENQRLDEKIKVKAIDKAGNVRVAIVMPENYTLWYKNAIFLVIISISIVAIAIFFFRKKYAKHR